MILAAGLGTRLKPLTDNIPKALLKINEKTLLEIVIEKLIKSGIKEIVINVHHLREKIIDYLSVNDFGIKIHLSVEDDILGTGGGIKNSAKYLSGCNSFLVYNVDIISSLDINKLYQFHLENKPLATLAIQQRNTSRPLIFDGDNSLVGRLQNNREKKYKEPAGKTFLAGFCGVHIISSEIFNNFTETGTFDIFTAYFRLVRDKKKMLGCKITDTDWIDVGTFNALNSFSKK
jgi:NDP-sugar pyrophosphorylase family protein